MGICKVCQTNGTEVSQDTNNDGVLAIKCKRCGNFTMKHECYTDLDKNIDFKLSFTLRTFHDKRTNPNSYTVVRDELLEEVKSDYEISISEKYCNLLGFIFSKSRFEPFKQTEDNILQLIARTCSMNKDELIILLQKAYSVNHLNNSNNSINLTYDGKHFLEKPDK